MELRRPNAILEVSLYQGDATTAEVLDSKKHVSKVSSAAMLHSVVLMCSAGGDLDLEKLQVLSPSQRMLCEL